MREPPAPSEQPWREALLRGAERLREVYLAHPWLVPMMSSVRALGPREAAWAESFLQVIQPLELPAVEALGLMGAVGHFILIMAYTRAPAATLTPYLYAQIAFAMLGGLIMFSHIPDQLSLAGIVMIAVCGAAGAWLTVRERRG